MRSSRRARQRWEDAERERRGERDGEQRRGAAGRVDGGARGWPRTRRVEGAKGQGQGRRRERLGRRTDRSWNVWKLDRATLRTIRSSTAYRLRLRASPRAETGPSACKSKTRGAPGQITLYWTVPLFCRQSGLPEDMITFMFASLPAIPLFPILVSSASCTVLPGLLIKMPLSRLLGTATACSTGIWRCTSKSPFPDAAILRESQHPLAH